MAKEVFITRTSSYFPNNPVENEEMEDYLGLIVLILLKLTVEDS